MKQLQDSRVARPSRAVGELLADAVEHAQGVIRTEAQLAVSQVQDGIEGALPKVALTGAAWLLITIALVMFLVAGVLYLATLMAAWTATLIVAAVAGIAAVVMLKVSSAR